MLPQVMQRIEAACTRCGRDPADVTLVAVSKGQSVEAIRTHVLAHGHRELGENRVQEFERKRRELDDGVRWHLIGHLQRNKASRAVDAVLIHSLDSERLAQALETEGARREHRIAVLVQVNVSGEESKYGVAPAQAPELVRYASSLPHVVVRGLMTMAPYAPDPEASRPVFRALRELGDRLGLPERSMGMSGDFEVAIEEGATLVRVGSALFPEPRVR